MPDQSHCAAFQDETTASNEARGHVAERTYPSLAEHHVLAFAVAKNERRSGLRAKMPWRTKA
jgi:hypothetical protein